MEILDILIYLGRKGALSRHITVSTPRMGGDLGISQQSVSRWLITLQKEDMISRKEGIRGYLLQITPRGKKYMTEKRNELGEILMESDKLVIRGTVVSGMMEGGYYIGLAGYSEKIKSRMGFRPFPGTLNIRLGALEDMECNERLCAMKGVEVRGFRKGKRMFGAIRCFSCRVEGAEGAVVIPERSHYGFQMLEIISPHNLREKLHLSDGDSIRVEVEAK